MFDMPSILILHQRALALFQDRGTQGRDVGLVAELGERGEERFEIEDDGAAEGHASERLPVDAEVALG